MPRVAFTLGAVQSAHVKSRMTISSNIFEAFLKCPTKVLAVAVNEPASGNAYAEWVRSQAESYRKTESERLLSLLPRDESVLSPPVDNLKTAKWRLAASLVVQAQMNSCVLSSEIHTVECLPSEDRNKPTQFIPIRFSFTNKVVKDEKPLLAFDAFVLSEMLGSEIRLGKIIHGDGHATHNVRISALASEVRNRIGKISAPLLKPVAARPCPESPLCRVRIPSPLLTEGGREGRPQPTGRHERQGSADRHRSKGIFTVNQLSYTFRPRRTPKRAKKPAKPRYSAFRRWPSVKKPFTSTAVQYFLVRKRKFIWISRGCRMASSITY